LAKQVLSRSQQNGYRTPKLKLVRDVINGVCHQCYTKCLEQSKSDPTVNVRTADENLEEEL